MQVELSTGRSFKDEPDSDYINHCCIGGDEILGLLAPALAEFSGDARPEIYQEDYGWVAELKRGDLSFVVVVSTNDPETGEFVLSVDAFQPKKGWIFTKRIPVPEAEPELLASIASASQDLGMTVGDEW